jgi:hypothetical protein
VLIRKPQTLFVVAIVATAAMFAIVSHATLPKHLVPLYDEAVYYSQVSGSPKGVWVPTRAPGLTYLIAPVAANGASVAQTRDFLMILNAILLAAVMVTWRRFLGWGVVATGVLFSVGWLPRWYGSTLHPNMPSALLSALTVGLWMNSGLWAHGLFITSASLATLVRPLDAAVALGICLILLLTNRVWRRDPVRWLVFEIACLLSAAPFVLEANQRFGGVSQRLHDSNLWAPSGWRWNGDDYGSMLDGPSRLPDPSPALDFQGFVWIGILIGACILGLFIARKSRRKAISVALGSGIAAALPYLVWFGDAATNSVASRFLIPAMLFACIGAGGALVAARSGIRLVRALTLAVILASVASPLEDSFAVEENAMFDRHIRVTESVATTISALAHGRPCSVAAVYNDVPLSVLTGCFPLDRYPSRNWVDFQLSKGRVVTYVSPGQLTKQDPLFDGQRIVLKFGHDAMFLYVFVPEPNED